MEHLLGQNSRIGLLMKSMNAGTCLSKVRDVQLIFVPPGAAVFGLQ